MIVVQREIKFFNELDKILKDNYKYVQCCLLCLADGIQEIVPTIFKTICEQLISHIENSKDGGDKKVEQEDLMNLEFIGEEGGAELQELVTSQLFNVSILLDMQINPLMRSRVLSSPMIQALASMLDVCDVNSFSGSQAFMQALLLICENISCNQKALTILSQPILTLLIPVLFHKLANSQSEDIKFLSFKIYSDMMSQFLADEVTMNSPLVKKSISQDFLPNLAYILTNEVKCPDPIPMFGLKLYSCVLQQDPSLVNDSLIQIVSEFYALGSPKLNRNTINIMRILIEQRKFSFTELRNKQILEKTNGLINSMLKNRQEVSLELMMDILHDLLNQLNEVVKSKEDQIVWHIEEVFSNFEACI